MHIQHGSYENVCRYKYIIQKREMQTIPEMLSQPSRRIRRSDRIGVVLFHWGGPGQVKDVRSFLRLVYDDRYRANGSKRLSNIQTAFSWLAAASMQEKVEKQLHAIGGCPTLKLAQEQVRGLENKLIRRWESRIDVKFRVYAAMRYAHPFARETANQMKQDSIEHVILVPAYLQESNAGRYKSVRHWCELLNEKEIPVWPTYEISPFGRVSGILNALSERIDQTIQRFPKPLRSDTAIIFCGPTMPGQDKVRFQEEVMQMNKEIMRKRGEKRPSYTAFYGHMGDELRVLKKTILKAAIEGNRCVILLPLCGTTECLQTSYTMDIVCREYANRAGIHHFEVAKALNSHTLFLETLSDLIGESVKTAMITEQTQRSFARQRYQLATLRKGFQESPDTVSSEGFGSASNL